MAGLYGLKILLLCTGLIELAICSQTKPTPPKCTYTVMPVSYGFQIDLKASTSDTYNISYQDESGKNMTVEHQTVNSTIVVTLKPCRKYTLTKIQPECELQGNSTLRTEKMVTGDSSTSTSDPASTAVAQTQTSDPASTLNQTPAFSTNTSTSQSQAYKNALPTSTPPIHNQTSPASTMTSTTAIPTGSQTKPTPPKCTYTVMPVSYGFQIDLKASTSDTYNISYQDESGKNMTVEHQTVNSTIVVTLKPCRKYTLTKIQPECELQGNSTLRTEKMDDLEFSTNTKPGYLCYVTKWDISDAEWNSPVITWDKDKCFELSDEHFCTNFTTNVAVPGGCSVNISKTIPITAEYSTVKHSPNLEYNNVEIVWKNKPKNCSPKDLDIHYTCEGNNGSINLTDLEPFQKYNCSGKITHNSKVINTKSIDAEIKCKVNITQRSSNTNTSISLKWTNQSNNCPKNTQLFHSCVSCRIETVKVKDCHTTDELHYDFNQLQPFTNYICSIEPRYKDTSYDTFPSVSETIQTAAGVPDEVRGKTSVTYTQNNAFTITCEELKPFQWKGKENWYIATITGSEAKKQKKCNFTFADLSYLADYTVQIFTYNGKYTSKRIETHITTRYNDKAVIGFLVFFIILMSLALLFFLYKIYNPQRKTSNTTSETKTTVIFISGTVPLPRGFRGVKTDAWYTLR
ncbi:receptor-type tyrosine-protein phosphatase C-like isoform X2 [Oncorhynchus masou masou]|uniref:receptor-type tyrosine-protein phosphatase C-like isoform X2 n=1 Tax=Oncorhynchus masou masou TaxID=90313 RepID=UPI0031841D22